MRRLLFALVALAGCGLLLAGSSTAAFPGTNGKIVFAGSTDPNGGIKEDVFVINADGTGMSQLTHDVTLDRMPVFSPSGQEIEWGAITVWEPPRRLGYSWHIATDVASATEVEIRFSDVGDERTRVDIEHRGWEKLAERGPVWRDTNRGGWEGTLPYYVAACAYR